MSLLTTLDVALLGGLFVEAQPDTTVTFYRYNQTTGQDDVIGPYEVQVAYITDRQTASGGQIGTEQALAGVRFYREAPFAVYPGDIFQIDGHKGGTIRRVGTDPVLGVKFAEGDYDVTVA